MKVLHKKILSVFCQTMAIITALPSHAQQTTPSVGSFNVNTSRVSNPIDNSTLIDIKNELLYLGYYLGFPIDPNSKNPPSTPSNPNQPSNMNKVAGLEAAAVKNLFGMMSSFLLPQPSFVPAGDSSGNNFGGYSLLNTLANAVLKNIYSITPVDAPWTGANIDTTTNPPSPVSQMVLNLLSNTADEQCFSTDSAGNSTWNNSCPYSYTTSYIFAQALGLAKGASANDLFYAKANTQNALATSLSDSGIVGSNQRPSSLFPSTSANPQILYLGQVDSSAFLSPLVYTAPSSEQNTKSAPLTNFDTTNQTNAAQAFLKNVTGNIIPSQAPAPKAIESVMNAISSGTDINAQLTSFKTLSKYLLGSRVYAAQESVAFQNIYEMMAKRMPYNDPQSASSATNQATPANPNPSSQALNEFIMATYRLYNPQGSTSPNTQWQNMIATTSTLNVEREIAVLLSELNYQLYLMRQQQERLVMTNSIILLNLLRAPSLENSQ